jgi:ubiquinone/menaquinone biosynthesis C-methylase UbiE
MTTIDDKNSNTCKQDAIWNYYQNKRAEEFQGARPRMAYLIKTIQEKHRTRGLRLLNIGAGNGDFEEMAALKGWEIYSTDPDEETVNRLKAMGIKAIQGRIEELLFEDEQFDFVVASEVLEHLTAKQSEEGLTEISRVLRPGGWFVGTVPYKENLGSNIVYCPNCNSEFHRWGHMRSFDLKSIRDDLNSLFGHVLVKRTAFVSLHGNGFWGIVKGGVRIVLAKLGEEIAVPSIFFMARKEGACVAE